MDSITQAALGATIAGAVAGKALGRSVLVTGAVLGTLPDLDVVIDYGTAVANFSQHRGFTHSLFVLIPLSIMLAWGLWRWKPVISYRRWLLLTGLILVTHPLLDTFTTYGTQLFWPLGPPIALHSIFIIDPLYTLPLLVAIGCFLMRPSMPRSLVVGLGVSTLYLGWTLVAQQIISSRVEPTLAAAGLDDAPRMVQPMPFNTILWRVTAISDDRRVEMVTGFLDGDAPLTLEVFPRDPVLAEQALALEEGQRLAWFTEGFLHYEQVDGLLLATDVRLGVPGAHPFTFVLAADNGNGLEPYASYRQDGPALRPELLGALWARLTGAAPVLCLASLELPPPGEGCS